MQIVINTIEGTYVVPADKQADLIYWLQQNAINVNQNNIVREQGRTQSSGQQIGRQLINE